MISLLNQAVFEYHNCTCFIDVYCDEPDDDEENVTHVCNNICEEDYSVSRLALEYGNACNVFLRSAACSYQAVILKLNCTTGEPIRPSNLSPCASQPTTNQTLDDLQTTATEPVISESPTTVADTTEPQTSVTSDSPTDATEGRTSATTTTTASTQKTGRDHPTSVPPDSNTGSAASA